MRYGLISDIHGNLEALDAVIDALAKERIESYLCVGDIIGYGANPKECIAKVRKLEPEMIVAGNHEWGVLGLLSMDYFNEYARKAVAWTKSLLNVEEMAYLRSFKLTASAEKITLVHGSLDEPEEFRYIFDIGDAEPTLEILPTQLCFVGHSHTPGIFYYDGKSSATIKGLKTKIDPRRRYVINIGSVGQPRDGDPRAAFAVYDEDARTVEIKRVVYDIKEAQRKILEAGLPPELASRLAEGH